MILLSCNRSSKLITSEDEQKKIEGIMRMYKKNVFGLDISHYQGKVNWNKLDFMDSDHDVEFVFVRATMGNDGVDREFHDNWEGAAEAGIIRGAYHFYRPNENSYEQAANFCKHVTLEPGDLPPVLDIETLPDPSVQSVESLRLGLNRFLDSLRRRYDVKPIIYTSDNFYIQHLKNHGFDQYPLWVANYNPVNEPKNLSWRFWQFTSEGRVEGIEEFVDMNVFRGEIEELMEMVID